MKGKITAMAALAACTALATGAVAAPECEMVAADAAKAQGAEAVRCTKADASLLAEKAGKRGRELYVAMVQANVEREGAGIAPVWPRTTAQKGTPKGDIAGLAFKSAAGYFSVLFDVKNAAAADKLATPEGSCSTDKTMQMEESHSMSGTGPAYHL